MKKRPPILSSYGIDPMDMYRRKWAQEDAENALIKLLMLLGIKI